MNWDKILKILILLSLVYILFYIKGCAYRDFTDNEIRNFLRDWEREEERRQFEPPEWRP